MCNGFGVSLEMEFGEDKAGDEYILVLDGIHPVSTCRLHLTHAPEDYWENVYYDIVVQETDWDTIWSQPTGREALSKDPAHKWKAEK